MASLPPIGSLYISDWNGIAWSQPGGVGTKVFPTLGDGPFTAYPVPGQFYSPSSQALWILPCGHGVDFPMAFRDYDNVNQSSVCVLCCSICTYILKYIEPYENIDNVLSYPILIP